MTFINQRDERRAIDIERCAVLTKGADQIDNIIYRGYIEGGRYTFTLKWHDDVIQIGARGEMELIKDDGTEAIITYIVEHVILPKNLDSRRAEVKELIIEALTAYGFDFGVAPGTTTNVIIPAYLELR